MPQSRWELEEALWLGKGAQFLIASLLLRIVREPKGTRETWHLQKPKQVPTPQGALEHMYQGLLAPGGTAGQDTKIHLIAGRYSAIACHSVKQKNLC